MAWTYRYPTPSPDSMRRRREDSIRASLDRKPGPPGTPTSASACRERRRPKHALLRNLRTLSRRRKSTLRRSSRLFVCSTRCEHSTRERSYHGKISSSSDTFIIQEDYFNMFARIDWRTGDFAEPDGSLHHRRPGVVHTWAPAYGRVREGDSPRAHVGSRWRQSLHSAGLALAEVPRMSTTSRARSTIQPTSKQE